jgi:ribosomal protein S18 acetylase RimI-like enzyme
LLTIRRAEERDREAILCISSAVDVFTAEEVTTADELLQAHLYDPEQRDYYFAVACNEQDHVLGFVCFGPTALTEGTFDLYWIAVTKSAHGRGVGRLLMEWTEEHLRAAGGRLLVAETSGTPEYAGTRRFYERLGYEGHLSVPDYYRPGDDLVVYSKHLR